ncbi:uncharacterized protein LOC114535196 [Dendronephthya gigantea]|uniref:uncharacterized protein LOC114535196 n=1 Tax=Dendronephthya gigantea TaxID=151771 RepID=UPI00106D663B|nr:uncharacterized protein LOC114535196 [Dendronephthya gigantea]
MFLFYGCYGHGHCNRPWTCSCNSGWTGSRCRSDINECSQTWKNSCSYKPGCINTDGSYRCTCANGFRLGSDRRRCNDINECRQHTHGCRHPASCQNTRGSYRCTCGSGYLLGSDQRTCKDINECTTYQNGCSYKAGCQNTVGSYLCTCPHGYYLDGDRRTCRDINECDNSDCHHNCINYPGGYTCSCNNGYRANTNDNKRCIDIDECSEKLAGCTQICTNTIGGFRCSCNPGYYLGWDQKICNDIDECKGNEHGCQHSCENSLGSYKCRCRTGFELFSDGKNCTGKPCLPIYTPVNGKKNCSGYTTDHTCSFSCSIGYKEVGSHTRRCTASKLWSGKEMKCKAIHCPAPREPKDGFIYSPCNTRFNSECRGGCNNGFYINDTSKLVCTVEGKWEPSQITCEEIKVCEPNPCKHGGKCTTLNPRQFSCNCSKTGYEGANCEIGVIDIPDYPTLVAGVPVESLEFRSSPPDNYVILTPQGFGVEFNPNYLRFQQNSNTTQSLTMTVRYPGLHYVRYYLSGPSAAGYEIPQPNALFVETVKKTDPEVFTAYDNMEFPSGCYKLEIDKCPRSNVTISAYSTSSWLTLLVGFPATTEGQVSLSNGNLEIPYSVTGYSFIPKSPSSLDKDCAANPSVEHSLKELVQHRILTKSFLKVFRRSLPKWLDIKLRGNHSSTSLVETDLHAFYLTGRRLREEFIEGQPLSDDTFFSLLLSPDIDLVVNGDRISFGLNDRNARFPLAIELCSPPPNNVLLQPSPSNLDVINQLSVMKKLRDTGWNFKIFSLQIGMSSGKKGLTMVAKLTKNLTISRSVTSRVDFQGTVVANVDNLERILESPLDEKWVVELNGNIILTLELEVHGKFTKLSLNMPQTRSNATFGGGDEVSCLRETKNNPNGLFLTRILKEDPFVNTELKRFVELDQNKDMSCFLSTLLYTEKQGNDSSYREKSDGVFLRFYGNLKFGALRFDNLDTNLWIKNKRCSINTAKGTRSDVVAELSGSYWHAEGMQKRLGMFEIDSDPVVNLHIGQKRASASGGSFSARVDVLGFKRRVNVNISQDGLRFRTRGKIHGWFDASAVFKSQLTEWKDQRFTAAGVFELRETDDNIDVILEKELKIYSTELLTKLEARLDLSLRTEQQAKFRLNDVQSLREDSVMKMVEMTKEYRRVNESLDLAKKRLDELLQLTEDYSEEIERLKQELDELCELKQCPKICRKGESCEICWKYVFVKKMGKCPATCNYRQLRLEFVSLRIAICPKQYCKWVYSPFMYLGYLIGAIFGTSLRLPPSVSFVAHGSTARFTRTTMQNRFNFRFVQSHCVIWGQKTWLLEM